MSESRLDGKIGLIVLGICLATGLIVSSIFIGNALLGMKHQRVIRVKGTAEASVISDQGAWRGEWVVRALDPKEGYLALESRRMLVNDMIKQYGFSPETKVVFHPVQMETEKKLDEHGNPTSMVEAYVLRQAVEIQSREVNKIDQIARQSPELIKHGIEFRAFPAQYTFTGIEKMKMDLLGRSMRNALERARALAENTNTTVGALVSATQGVFQITAPNSTEVSDYGSYDTSTIEKTVKAVVSCEFSVSR
ncbi:SIMPL domain-containing protein [Myxococcota bacterium]|nr:SIMPL domain-containing protein [Myxococcota bacterium]MBU1411526.1 SIMPL domain-containing protein [Myxococcota bacterium]MBU1510137.1 SIMPL domain-containing protein [Myxococcota bacterium]